MRLIDADTLINNLSEKEKEYSSAKAYETASIIHWIKTIYIDNLPTVDAEPIRHGHWIEVSPQESYKCSVCSLITDWEDIYCPNCGAKMDEVENENLR